MTHIWLPNNPFSIVIFETRNPSKCVIPQGSGGSEAGSPITDEKFISIAGDVTNKADVDKVFAENDIDAVIVGLGGKTSDVGDTMLTDGTKNIIAAMKENDVKRIAVVTVRPLIIIIIIIFYTLIQLFKNYIA